MFGYGLCPITGGEGVEPAWGGALAGRGIMPVPVLFENPLAVRDEPSIDASAASARVPVWVEPVHGYRSPMCKAIAVAGAHVHDWADTHPDSFPPLVINITDGLATDEPYEGADLRGWARRLTSISTNNGPTLLLNIFLSPGTSQEVLLPASARNLPAPAPELFSISSVAPPVLVENARHTSLEVSEGARAFCFNAGLETLVRFLGIGTRVSDVRR